LAAGDETTGYKYIEEALGLAKEDPSKQAEIYEDRAGLKNKANKWSDARADYLKVIELDASRANDIYTKIGNMYYSSFKACLADGGDPVKDRAVYFAAYDMYAKAGDNEGMSKARAQFPTKADIFTYAAKGYKEGGSIGIGCWIGGASTIRAR
jgi:tetratricopeptide (TPR) repeat protein